MKCPHCTKETKGLVSETRNHQGDIYRRRMCGLCFRTFVTTETAPPKLKMPTQTASRNRKRSPLKDVGAKVNWKPYLHRKVEL